MVKNRLQFAIIEIFRSSPLFSHRSPFRLNYSFSRGIIPARVSHRHRLETCAMLDPIPDASLTRRSIQIARG